MRSDLKGAGLGVRLLNKMIDHLRAHGTRRLVGTVLSANPRMLELARDLGFVVVPNTPADDDTVQLQLPLNPG